MQIFDLNLIDVDMTSFYMPQKEDKKKFDQWIDESLDTPMSLADRWEPLIILPEEIKKAPDFFDIDNQGAIIVTADAAATLLLCMHDEDDFELLPFSSDQNFFLFNIIRYTDCLEKEESDCEYFMNGMISDFENLVFDLTKLEGKPFFKIKEFPYRTFVTSDFLFFYEMYNLTNLSFEDSEAIYVG